VSSIMLATKAVTDSSQVFAILFTEPAGANAANAANIVTDYNTAFSRVQYNELAYTQVRRFIIVMHKREHCYAM
jgi:hypothetical protein